MNRFDMEASLAGGPLEAGGLAMFATGDGACAHWILHSIAAVAFQLFGGGPQRFGEVEEWRFGDTEACATKDR